MGVSKIVISVGIAAALTAGGLYLATKSSDVDTQIAGPVVGIETSISTATNCIGKERPYTKEEVNNLIGIALHRAGVAQAAKNEFVERFAEKTERETAESVYSVSSDYIISPDYIIETDLEMICCGGMKRTLIMTTRIRDPKTGKVVGGTSSGRCCEEKYQNREDIPGFGEATEFTADLLDGMVAQETAEKIKRELERLENIGELQEYTATPFACTANESTQGSIMETNIEQGPQESEQEMMIEVPPQEPPEESLPETEPAQINQAPVIDTINTVSLHEFDEQLPHRYLLTAYAADPDLNGEIVSYDWSVSCGYFYVNSVNVGSSYLGVSNDVEWRYDNYGECSGSTASITVVDDQDADALYTQLIFQ